MKYKKGDLVRVWSLQSFSHGGFLKGAKAVVRQNQTGDSVIVCVVRNIGGEYKVDTSYEVYAEQLKPYIEDVVNDNSYQTANKKLLDVKNALDNNLFLSDIFGSNKYI